jgi:hypothetical protein
MPEFLVPQKYKSIFNDYDLSVIKADHRPAEPTISASTADNSLIASGAAIPIPNGCHRPFLKPSARSSD